MEEWIYTSPAHLPVFVHWGRGGSVGVTGFHPQDIEVRTFHCVISSWRMAGTEVRVRQVVGEVVAVLADTLAFPGRTRRPLLQIQSNYVKLKKSPPHEIMISRSQFVHLALKHTEKRFLSPFNHCAAERES